MRSEEILERVRPLIAETYDVGEGSIEMETNFIGDYKTDHAHLISLMDKVEMEFDIFLADYEKKRADNVRALVRMISSSLKKHRWFA